MPASFSSFIAWEFHQSKASPAWLRVSGYSLGDRIICYLAPDLQLLSTPIEEDIEASSETECTEKFHRINNEAEEPWYGRQHCYVDSLFLNGFDGLVIFPGLEHIKVLGVAYTLVNGGTSPCILPTALPISPKTSKPKNLSSSVVSRGRPSWRAILDSSRSTLEFTRGSYMLKAVFGSLLLSKCVQKRGSACDYL